MARRGCNVVINGSSDRAACDRTADEAGALGVEALVAMGDVSSPDTIADIALAARERFSGVDILVNNAGFRPHKPFLENTDEDWHRVLAIDLTASFLTSAHSCHSWSSAAGAGSSGWPA